MKRGLMITCEDASYLIIKNDIGNLKPWERFRLSLHLALCKLCRRFKKQNTIINSGVKKIEEKPTVQLSEKSKKRILHKIQ